MPKIGVDSSGHVKNPPIWFVGSRLSKKKGQIHYSVYISPQKHKEFEESTLNWDEKISAILIFKVICPIFYEGDAIIVDKDFQGSTCKRVETYLKKLLANKYQKSPLMSNPNVFFIPENHCEEVKHAHIKSKKLRYKCIPINEKDPSFEKELDLLK
jgi:hypothetical protein